MIQQHPSGIGELDSAVGAIEEPGAQAGLEALDLLAEGWLRDSKPSGRPAEMELLGDGEEGAEVAQLEFGSHIFAISIAKITDIGHIATPALS
jgi:hypothetical protein